MKLYLPFFAFCILAASPSFAVPKITAAKIIKIENTPTDILLWLEYIEGDPLAQGASGYFGQSAKTRLVLAESLAQINDRKHMLASAINAYTVGALTWFYWDTSNHLITSLMTAGQL